MRKNQNTTQGVKQYPTFEGMGKGGLLKVLNKLRVSTQLIYLANILEGFRILHQE